MARAHAIDADILQAALIGFQYQRNEIAQKITEVRSRIGGAARTRAKAISIEPALRKRKISAAGRKRIAEAQRKRWAAVRKARKQEAEPKPPAKKAATTARVRRVAVRKAAPCYRSSENVEF